MPEVGSVKYGKEIGKSDLHKFVWQSCPDCGAEKWIQLRNGQPVSLRCNRCANIHSHTTRDYSYLIRGDKHHFWKGGTRKNENGYVEITIQPDNPYYSMSQPRNHTIPEHRYVMAKHLGRCLLKSEQVHHINGIKNDNRIENLELVSRENHNIKTFLCSKCELKKEIRLLRWQIKELLNQLQERLKIKDG